MFYEYCVVYYEEGRNRKVEGITCGDNYSDAARKIDNYYENIVSLMLFESDIDEVFELDGDMVQEHYFKIKVTSVDSYA